MRTRTVLLSLLLLIVVTGATLVFLYQKTANLVFQTHIPAPQSTLSELPKPPEEVEKFSSVNYQDTIYNYRLEFVKDPTRLQLYPNFSDHDFAHELYSERNCRLLVNGGFYDKKNNPIGWFVSESQHQSDPVKNPTFDGYIMKLSDNTISISIYLPEETPQWGLQTGPLLIHNSQVLTLTIRNDTPERRTVVGITEDNKVFFLVVVDSNLETAGPYLAELPKVIETIFQQESIRVVQALNLDGGSASAFITENIVVKEYSAIGSYFCEHKD